MYGYRSFITVFRIWIALCWRGWNCNSYICYTSSPQTNKKTNRNYIRQRVCWFFIICIVLKRNKEAQQMYRFYEKWTEFPQYYFFFLSSQLFRSIYLHRLTASWQLYSPCLSFCSVKSVHVYSLQDSAQQISGWPLLDKPARQQSKHKVSDSNLEESKVRVEFCSCKLLSWLNLNVQIGLWSSLLLNLEHIWKSNHLLQVFQSWNTHKLLQPSSKKILKCFPN